MTKIHLGQSTVLLTILTTCTTYIQLGNQDEWPRNYPNWQSQHLVQFNQNSQF